MELRIKKIKFSDCTNIFIWFSIVIFHKWAGQDVKEDNKEYRLVKFSDLMGVYE